MVGIAGFRDTAVGTAVRETLALLLYVNGDIVGPQPLILAMYRQYWAQRCQPIEYLIVYIAPAGIRHQHQLMMLSSVCEGHSNKLRCCPAIFACTVVCRR